MALSITPERPDTPTAVALIGELEAVLAPSYPAESRHGYSIEKLLAQGVAFFVARVDGEPAGCGGVQIFDGPGEPYGELKRMFVRPAFRGQGLGRRMIEHLAGYAAARGVELLRLETGIHQHEAIALYERAGFTRVPPFGAYREDPLSIFFERRIEA